MRHNRKKITLRAIVAVPDSYGRLRFLIPTATPMTAIREGAPAAAGWAVPYKTWEPDAEGLKGEFCATAPAAKRAYWTGLVEGLRGQAVDVEVAVRRYSFRPQGAPEAKRGYALDLADIREVPPAGPGL